MLSGLRKSLLVSLSAARAATPEELFALQIRPVLESECFGCHGQPPAQGKLDLRTRDGMLRGGSRGPALRPGDGAASPLYIALTCKDLEMPPGGSKRLPAGFAAAIKSWIDAGAPWPAVSGAARWSCREEDLWALRPLRRRDRAQTIDSFIDGKLSENRLAPAPPASRRGLIRRVTIDLTGLPPTPEEIEAFLNDRSPGAWASDRPSARVPALWRSSPGSGAGSRRISTRASATTEPVRVPAGGPERDRNESAAREFLRRGWPMRSAFAGALKGRA